VMFVTGDQDYLQLVNDRTTVLTPQVGFQKTKLYDSEAVFEKLGVTPEQVVDFKALKGDASDNVPGVPGIGTKTAAKLLQEYTTLEGVYEHVSDLKGKLRENLETYKDQAFLSRDLVVLDKAVDIGDFDIQTAEFHVEDLKKVEPLLLEYECFSLVRKLRRLSGEEVPANRAKVKKRSPAADKKAEEENTQQSLF